MNRDFVVEALKSNWYLVAALGVMLCAGIATALMPKGALTADAQAIDSKLAATENGPQARMLSPGRFKPGKTKAQKATDVINRYKKELADNVGDPALKRNLLRIGNLYYSSLRDYDSAIQYYELMLIESPDETGVRDTLPVLAQCYVNTNQRGLEYETYRRMLEHFPANSQHYLFAKEKLRTGY